jgi:hypothetical protein
MLRKKILDSITEKESNSSREDSAERSIKKLFRLRMTLEK